MKKILSLIIIGILTSLVTVIPATTVYSATVLLDEDFSGTFPPAGWSTDLWVQSDSSYAGGEQPEAYCYLVEQGDGYYYNYITSKAVDASYCENVTLEYKYRAELCYDMYGYFYIKYRKNSTSPWEDITPWDNPLPGITPMTITINIDCGPDGCGNAFQVNWSCKLTHTCLIGFWLDDVKIICCEPPNNPPTAPTITGETSGKAGTEYEYTFNATDSDGDEVKYIIDWGDNNTEETGFNASGTEVKVNHTWDEDGTYNITAIAEDINGAQGPEGTLTVEIPRNRAVYQPLLLQLFKRFTKLFPILSYLLVFQ